ncbi:unnamed protein product [Effrenium voratum]|nr:unnamed protein product [Effrenium voratum]
MRKFFKKKETEDRVGVSAPSLPPSVPADEGPSDLAFLPPSRGGDWPPRKEPDRWRSSDPEEIVVPGARKTKLAGLFDEHADDEPLGASGMIEESKKAQGPAAAAVVQQPSAEDEGRKILWSGLTRLFRLDDAGAEMVEVDAGEGQDGLFVAVLRSSEDQMELLVYTAIRKRRRLRTPVALIELASAETAVSFYDDTGIYWSLQLEKADESVPLLRLLLAAKAVGSGATAMVELSSASSEAVASTFCLTEVCHRCLREAESKAPVPTCTLLSQDALDEWGSGVAAALAGVAAGSVNLVAVPAGLQAPGLRAERDAVLLLQVAAQEVAPEAAQPAQPAQGGAATEESRRLSVKERMARLAAAGLPPGAVGHMPLTTPPATPEAVRRDAGADPAPALPTAVPAAHFEPPRPAAAPLTAPAPLPAPVPSLPSREAAVGHPSAEIIREYWSAVQDTGYGAPYAYLGAMPFVPGLTRNRDLKPAEPLPFSAPGYMTSMSSMAGMSNMSSMAGMAATAAPHESSSVSRYMGTSSTSGAPLSSVCLGDLVAAVRDVVRAEATPEGWQAERQKLERRASLLEEQLRSSKAHQDQLRDAMRAQHAQLADAQMMVQQMREQQLRLEGDRQMRELELDSVRGAMEAELRQGAAEVQQLRLEQRSLQEQLAIAKDCQQRAEYSAAAASGTAASLSSAEARLAEASQMATTLRQQLVAMTASRSAEAIAISRGVLAVAYVGVAGCLPKNPSALVAAEGVSQRLRAACRQSGKVFEQHLQMVSESSLSGLNWEAIEAQTLAELGAVVLPDASETHSAAQAHVLKVETEANTRAAEIQRLQSELLAHDQRLQDARKAQQVQQGEAAAEISSLRRQLEEERASREEERQKWLDEEARRKETPNGSCHAHAAMNHAESSQNEQRLRQQMQEQDERREREDATRRQQQEEEALRQKQAEDERRQREDAARRQQEEEEALRKKQEEDKRREREEATRRQQQEEETLRQKQEEDERREREEATRRQQQEEDERREREEATRRQQEEEEALRQKQEEDERREREEATRRQQQEEEALQQKQEEDERREREEAARQQQEAEEALRQKQEEDERREREEAATRQQAEEEVLRQKQEEDERREREEAATRQQAEEEVLRQKQEEDERREREEATRRQQEEEESLRQKQEEDERREREEAARQQQDEEEALRQKQEEDQRREREEAARRQQEEESEALRQKQEEDERTKREEAATRQNQEDEAGMRRASDLKATSKKGVFDDAKRASAASLFGDDDDDEVFSVAKPKKTASPKARASLFGDDSDEDDLFKPKK